MRAITSARGTGGKTAGIAEKTGATGARTVAIAAKIAGTRAITAGAATGGKTAGIAAKTGAKTGAIAVRIAATAALPRVPGAVNSPEFCPSAGDGTLA